MRVYRLDPRTQEKQLPALQDGHFVLADPAHGGERHHARNKTLVRTEDEMVDLIMNGFAVRIATGTRPSLVRLNLYLDGRKVT